MAQTKGNAAPQPQIDDTEIEIVAKKLCKSEPIVGTRIPRPRKCDTARQLAQYREEAREIITAWRQRPCAAGTTTGDAASTLSC